jgi:excisionase family DNA binding protein
MVYCGAMHEKPVAPSPIVPRLLRIPDAAQYLSCTYTFIETLIREKKVPSIKLGKRRLIDRIDLDAFVDRKKAE